MTSSPGDSLAAALARLVELLGPEERPAVAELQRRLHQDRLRVLVAGEAKRGKSTLINALLGEAVLPTGVLPLTSVTTTVTYGDMRGVDVEYADGGVQQARIDDLPDLVTEVGNPHNERGVESIVVRGPYPLLRSGVELVDTPGVGSVYEHNSQAAREALRAMDAAIFVTSASPPVAASERRFLAELREHAVQAFVVLSKVDQIAERDRPVVRDFVARVASEALGAATTPAPVSALQAISGGEAAWAESGMADFTTSLTAYLDTRRRADLLLSVAGQAARLATHGADDVRLTLRGADLAADALREMHETFTARLTDIRRLADEAQALAAAAIERLIGRTTAAADNERRAASARIADGLHRWLLERGARSASELERDGQAWIADAVAAETVRWRARQQRWLDGELGGVTAQLQDRLDEQIAAVRAAAADAFGVELDLVAVAVGLPASRHFARYGGEMDGFSGLLAAGVRTRLPGDWGRRRVADHLHGVAAAQTDRGFGRARADIQYRLQEAGREIRAALGQRYEAAVARVERAIDAGAELSSRATADRRVAADDLRDRQAALEAVAAACGRLATRSRRAVRGR